jgi:hypothetical protein
MKAILSTLGTLAIIVIVVIVTVDVASTPTATKGQCLLTKRIILPDICANSCNPPFDCTTSTRPYLIFFTQSATCAAAVLCAP